MPQVLMNSKLKLDIQPDKTLYGPKAVTIKTHTEKNNDKGRDFPLRGLSSIRSKIVMLALVLSFIFFVGFGVIIVSAGVIQQINLIVAAAVCLVMLGIVIVTITVLPRWIIAPIKKTSLVRGRSDSLKFVAYIMERRLSLNRYRSNEHHRS